MRLGQGQQAIKLCKSSQSVFLLSHFWGAESAHGSLGVLGNLLFVMPWTEIYT